MFFFLIDSSNANKTIDLTKIAELLENSIKLNDKYTVRRILDENYSFFRIKASCSFNGNNDKKLTTNISCGDFQNSSIKNLNTATQINHNPAEIPSIFFNLLHLAIENNSIDVLRICLKYGLDPNETGTSYTNVKFNASNKYSSNKKSILYPVKCNYCKKRNKASSQKPSTNKNYFNIKYQDSQHEETCESQDFPSLSPYPSTSEEVNYSSYEYLVRLAPIFLSISRCNHSATELLLTYEACSNIQDEFGNTPLHLAIAKQPKPCHECIYILLKNHATSLVFNNKFQTPLYLIEFLSKKDQTVLENSFGYFY